MKQNNNALQIILLFFAALTMTACGQKEITKFEVNETILPYYNKFIHEGQIRGRDLSTNNLVMKFGEMPSNRTIAYCTFERKYSQVGLETRTQNTPVVVFSTAFWQYSNDIQRQETVDHELGHCLMHLDHNDATSPYGYPESIMNTYSVSRSHFYTYAQNVSYYLDQLFGLRTYALTDSPNNGGVVASTFNPNKTYVSTIDGCDQHDHKPIEIQELEDLDEDEENR